MNVYIIPHDFCFVNHLTNVFDEKNTLICIFSSKKRPKQPFKWIFLQFHDRLPSYWFHLKIFFECVFDCFFVFLKNPLTFYVAWWYNRWDNDFLRKSWFEKYNKGSRNYVIWKINQSVLFAIPTFIYFRNALARDGRLRAIGNSRALPLPHQRH